MILSPRLKVLAVIAAVAVIVLIALVVSNVKSGKIKTKADVNNAYSPYFFSTGGPVGNSDALRAGGQATWRFSHVFDPNSVLANQYGRGGCVPVVGSAISSGGPVFGSGISNGCSGVSMEYTQLVFEIKAISGVSEETIYRSSIIDPTRQLTLLSGQSRVIEGVNVVIPQTAKQVKSLVTVVGTISTGGQSSPVFGTGISPPVFGTGIGSSSTGGTIPVNYQQEFTIYNLTSVSSAACPNAGSLAENLVLCLPLNEGSGSTAIDRSRYSNNGQIGGGAAYISDCKEGGCLSFDGVDDNIVVPDSQSLNPAKVTVAAWIKPASSNQGTILAKLRFADPSKFASSYALTNDVSVDIAGSSVNIQPYAKFIVTSATNELGLAQAVFPENTWQFIVGTFDGSITKLYVNGLEKESGTISANQIIQALGPLRIGYIEGTSQKFKGQLDQPMVWDRALSAIEVKQIYDSFSTQTAPPAPTPLSFTNQQVSNITPTSATVSVTTNTPTTLLVGYTTDKKFDLPYDVYTNGPGAKTSTQTGTNFSFNLTGLTPSTTYYFRFIKTPVTSPASGFSELGSFTTLAAPAPTVDIKAFGSNGPIAIRYNTAATLTWKSTNATSCTASNGWSGSKPTNNATGQSTGSLTVSKTFTITCGSATDSVVVNVVPPDPPTVTLTANPATITAGQTTTLSWTSTNATSCPTATPAGWFTSTSNSGAIRVQPTRNSTYSITCTGAGGSASKSVTVTVR
ncbi:hypothetical protein HYZ64_01920 [Candidatus Berkelbacteria bacterium]|nr:hypothetical protein [Candidatus Berkelbacteria bacterium]